MKNFWTMSAVINTPITITIFNFFFQKIKKYQLSEKKLFMGSTSYFDLVIYVIAS